MQRNVTKTFQKSAYIEGQNSEKNEPNTSMHAKCFEVTKLPPMAWLYTKRTETQNWSKTHVVDGLA